MYKLLSFDVYGTLINTPPINVKAFRLILEQAAASNVDALAFYQFWESRNIVHYREPYRRYREDRRAFPRRSVREFRRRWRDS